ncbi:competence protein ComK [Bacillus sp. FJAT-50079]|uniref:Rok-like winged helix domain-containing protein n=1 Tax=Bacillus sp. FJAT-50079 TaxID=2833577 RepID=UPI001BC8E75F|nr:competence protein ComK [Bacillus sp. FJAT-50079]MBS4209888.1 competence protein ComK [Bacillus sp. FJAT-50079]
MFDERMALKMRLEQMKDAEERLLTELRKERAFIFNRLRELDEQENTSNSSEQAELQYLESIKSFIEGPSEDEQTDEDQSKKNRRRGPSRRSKTTKMRDTAVSILKEQTEPIRGVDLKKLIEDRTGFRIANMTTFMKTIEKVDENIIKVGRGLYTYHTTKNEPIILGMDDFPMKEQH